MLSCWRISEFPIDPRTHSSVVVDTGSILSGDYIFLLQKSLTVDPLGFFLFAEFDAVESAAVGIRGFGRTFVLWDICCFGHLSPLKRTFHPDSLRFVYV